jgi:hypothetical protein
MKSFSVKTLLTIGLFALAQSSGLLFAQGKDNLTKEFKSLEEIVASGGKPQEWKIAGKWNQVLVDKASQKVQADAKGKKASIKLKMGKLESFEGSYRIKVPDDRVLASGNSISASFWVYFAKDASDQLAKVSKGQEVTVRGIVKRADVGIYGGQPTLSVDISDARIE